MRLSADEQKIHDGLDRIVQSALEWRRKAEEQAAENARLREEVLARGRDLAVAASEMSRTREALRAAEKERDEARDACLELDRLCKAAETARREAERALARLRERIDWAVCALRKSAEKWAEVARDASASEDRRDRAACYAESDRQAARLVRSLLDEEGSRR